MRSRQFKSLEVSRFNSFPELVWPFRPILLTTADIQSSSFMFLGNKLWSHSIQQCAASAAGAQHCPINRPTSSCIERTKCLWATPLASFHVSDQETYPKILIFVPNSVKTHFCKHGGSARVNDLKGFYKLPFTCTTGGRTWSQHSFQQSKDTVPGIITFVRRFPILEAKIDSFLFQATTAGPQYQWRSCHRAVIRFGRGTLDLVLFSAKNKCELIFYIF